MNMKRILAIMAMMAACSVYAVDRAIVQAVDTATARVEPTALYLFRGESVSYTVTPTRNGAAIIVSTNAAARWYATLTTNVTLTVIDIAGTVGTNGVAVFSLTTNQTAMAAGTYDSYVQLSDTGGVLCASRSTLVVYKSTFTGATVPSTNAYYLMRTDPDGTTCIYSNGKLRVISSGSGTSENFGTNAAFISVSNTATSAAADAALGATNVTGNILSLIGRQISLVTSNLTAVLNSVYAAIVHDHPSTAITNAPWTTANDVTNSLDLSVSPSLTNPVAKALGALQAEADTFPSILDRGLFATNTVGRTVNILGAPSPVSFVVPQNWFLEFGNLGGRTNFLGVDAADYFIRVNADGVAYRIHDDDSFAAGTDYLAPGSVTLASLGGVSNSMASIAAAGGVTNAVNTTNAAGVVSVSGGTINIGTTVVAGVTGAITNNQTGVQIGVATNVGNMVINGTLTLTNTFTGTRAALIDGTSNEVQQVIEGHATQTAPVFVTRQSGGGTTYKSLIDNTGNAKFAGIVSNAGEYVAGNIVATGSGAFQSSLTLKGQNAWINPQSVTSFWGWSKTATEVTLTNSVTQVGAVVIPDTVDNLPVTTLNNTLYSSSTLKALYHFDGTNTDEVTGTQGTPVSSPVFTNDAKYGSHSIYLNGTSYFQTVNNNPLPEMTKCTLMCWVKRTASTGAGGFVFARGGVSFGYRQNVDGAIAWIGSAQYTVTNGISLNVWTHTACTIDGATGRLYINGVLVASGNVAGNLPLTVGQPFMVGNDTGANKTTGMFDDVAIYNRDLSATEISNIYASASALPTGGTGADITSVSGGNNLTAIPANLFSGCMSLTNIVLGPNVASIGNTAFAGCSNLTSITWLGNAPSVGTTIFTNSPNVTNYVSNPTATGWGATLGGQPVVRMNVASPLFYFNPTTFLFSDGTNLFYRNSNNQTNAVTAN